MKKPFTHIVCDLLAASPAPLTASEIARKLGKQRSSVKSSLNNLVAGLNIDRVKRGNESAYVFVCYPLDPTLRHAAKHTFGKSGSGKIAARRELAPFIPLHRNPFSAWELAMCAQR